MQLKNSYDIATNVCSRKSATTFGDLPDCLWNIEAHCPFILFEIITRMIEVYVRIAGVLGREPNNNFGACFLFAWVPSYISLCSPNGNFSNIVFFLHEFPYVIHVVALW